jgi:uncharacterized protein
MLTLMCRVAVAAFALTAMASTAVAQTSTQPPPNTAAPATKAIAKPKPAVSAKPKLVALHVDQNEPAVMNLTLNNAQNIIAHYKALSTPVKIEIVTYGPGLFMLRDDKSPVKSRISALALEEPNITFAACANTRDNMAKAEGGAVPLMSEARIVPSGVVRLIELQGQGYAYIKP